MNRLKPSIGEIYHVYNRGVDKRKVFMNEKDYVRFIHDLFEFNDSAPVFNSGYHLQRKSNNPQTIEVSPKYIKRDPRKLLVGIRAVWRMPNHFHLLRQQRTENGIPLFMKKLGAGYTVHFNQKYERSGSLFQGVYKSVHIQNESHFIHLPYYIHLNPLDLIAPAWRTQEKNINYKEARTFLDTYRWSSHLDYMGKHNFPSVTQRNFLNSLFTGKNNYPESIFSWLKNGSLDIVENLALETIY